MDMCFTSQRQAKSDAAMDDDHVYYNEGRVTVSSVTSPTPVDKDGYTVTVNQPSNISENQNPKEPMCDNTYETLEENIYSNV